jgi:D-alanyl-D-alanine carboxypeptidase
MRSFFVITAMLLISTSCKKSNDEVVTVIPPLEVQKDIVIVDNAVTSFMNTYNIPGVSIAVTKVGKLVYVKSYGQISATDNTPISNNNIYRLGGISKTITGIGIMKLLEANALTLDSKVFGPASILGTDFPSTQLAGVSDITIRNLLHQTVGAWPNNATDPMELQPTLTQSQLISWTLDNYPAPIANRGLYRYSNFTYSVLSRVIEKLSGKTYEQYIKDAVLSPCGINNMLICENTQALRKTNEVIYNGQSGENPYGLQLKRADGTGGWLGSATSLARLLIKVDGFSNKPDILSAASITTMTTRSVPSSYYACGWVVDDNNNWGHFGTLPGAASEIYRSTNGFNWVILCNSKSVNANFFTSLDALLTPFATNTGAPWQDIDQF